MKKSLSPVLAAALVAGFAMGSTALADGKKAAHGHAKKGEGKKHADKHNKAHGDDHKGGCGGKNGCDAEHKKEEHKEEAKH